MTSRLVASIGALALVLEACRGATRAIEPGRRQSRIGISNALGRTGSAGHLERRNVDAAAATGQVRQQAGPHAGGSGQGRRGSPAASGPRESIRLAAPKRTSRAPTTSSLFSGRTNCRTAARHSSSIRLMGGSLRSLREARKRVDEVRAYLQALLQGSSGGRPGPPSPRHAEPPPVYNVDRMNRANGPGGPLAGRALSRRHAPESRGGLSDRAVSRTGGHLSRLGTGAGICARRSGEWERACPGSHPLLER